MNALIIRRKPPLNPRFLSLRVSHRHSASFYNSTVINSSSQTTPNNGELTAKVKRSCSRKVETTSMAGKTRAAVMGGRRGLVLCALWTLVEVSQAGCGMSELSNKIQWPSQQCTLPCPGYENKRCSISEIPSVSVEGRTYCCVCDDSGDRYNFKLCPITADPAPPDQTQVAPFPSPSS